MTLRGLYLVALYLLVAVAAGSLLGWLLSLVSDYAYDKLLSRSILLFAALGLVPLWRYSGLSAATIGLTRHSPQRAGRVFWRQLALAYVFGIAMVLPLMLFFFVVGFRVIDTSVDHVSLNFAGLILLIFASAWLVAVFEEVLFRGVLYTALRRRQSFWAAGLITSTIYALVHFLERGERVLAEPQWFSGFLYVFDAFAGLGAVVQVWDSVLALFLLGWLFAWVREYLGLWVCISLHAAWVCAIRLFKEITVRDVVNPFVPWVGEYDNFVGNLVSFWLLFAFVVVALQRIYKASSDRA